jgi:hypothetical protein
MFGGVTKPVVKKTAKAAAKKAAPKKTAKAAAKKTTSKAPATPVSVAGTKSPSKESKNTFHIIVCSGDKISLLQGGTKINALGGNKKPGETDAQSSTRQLKEADVKLDIVKTTPVRFATGTLMVVKAKTCPKSSKVKMVEFKVSDLMADIKSGSPKIPLRPVMISALLAAEKEIQALV